MWVGVDFLFCADTSIRNLTGTIVHPVLGTFLPVSLAVTIAAVRAGSAGGPQAAG